MNGLTRRYFEHRIARRLDSRRGELYLRSAIFPRLNAIYLPVPKSAGTTIFSTLIALDGSPHLSGIRDHNLDEARRLLSAVHDPRLFWKSLGDPACLKFSFVRNPYTRTVSCYLDKIRSGQQPEYAAELDLSKDASLMEFLQRISQQEFRAMNRHWRPQSILLSPRVRLDFLGRFETFRHDFEHVLDLLGQPHAVRDMRAHQTSAERHLDLIGPGEKQIIDSVYQGDFERFGYDPRL